MTLGKDGFWSLLGQDRELRTLLLVASTLWIYTTILKLPFVVPSNYSDVAFLWIRDVYQGHHDMGVPYVDYPIEYPQVIAAVIWVGQVVSTYAPLILDIYNTYVVVESVIQYPFMIGTIYLIYKFCCKLQIDTRRIYLYVLTTLTFVVYGFYNWDFIVAFFVCLSISYYLEKKFDQSALALGLAILSKFIPLLMLPAMLACLGNHRARLRFFCLTATVWGLANLPFASANLPIWLTLYTHTSDHQLQNTWISMVISLLGLGTVVSGRTAGHYLSLAVIGYLILRVLAARRDPLEKICLSWYAWFGAIYLFDPQMFIQLFPIVVLTPAFSFRFYRLADTLNAFIILFYFVGTNHPELPRILTDPLTPFGLINTCAALRQLIFLGAYFFAFDQERREKFIGVLQKICAVSLKRKSRDILR